VLIRGDRLTSRQRAEVLRTFVHRWTHENARQTYGGQCPGCVQSTRGGQIVTGVKHPRAGETPLKVWTRAEWHAYHVSLQTDAEWLAAHAFHFVRDGSKLDARRRHAEPASVAGLAGISA
jgi:hypothetical protein